MIAYLLYNRLHMERYCWIQEELRNNRVLTKAGLETQSCSHRGWFYKCRHPDAQQERVIVYDRALLTAIKDSFPFCTAVTTYLASQGQ